MKTLEWEDNKLKLIDQRKLPDELTYVFDCSYNIPIIIAINISQLIRKFSLINKF